MLIYCDAGQNRSFNYFVFTDHQGRVLGHKLYVRKSGDEPSVIEANAIIAAIYWAKIRNTKCTILTDFKGAIDVFYGRNKPARRQLHKLQVLLRRLLLNTNLTLTWIPRQLNVAGRFLETVPKGRISRDAEVMLNFLKGAQ